MAARMKLDIDADMLGVIDVQPSFMAGGDLAVTGGDEVAPVINRLLNNSFRHAFAAQDWHPAGYQALDSPSAFFENDGATSTGLRGWLADRGGRRLFLTGLAGDFCVAWWAENAVRAGFETFIVEDVTRSFAMPQSDGQTSHEHARQRLQALGVGFITSADP